MTKNIKTKKILKQVQNDKNVETGRSMTEMLGTLAIIGVLSIGGIAGYTYAMNKHYANELLAGASERVVLMRAQIASGREPSLKEFDKIETAGGTFDSAIKKWDGEFGIKVSDVKEAVCKNLFKATQGTETILVNTNGLDLAETDCSGDSNEFYFAFATSVGENNTANRNKCSRLEKGYGEYEGECVYCSDINIGYGEYEGKCVLCNQDDLWFNRGAPHEGVCIKCSTLGPGYAPNGNLGAATECVYCPDRGDGVGAVDDGYTCTNCYEEDLVVDDNGNCIECSSLGTRWAIANKEESSWDEWNTNGECVECQIKSGYGLYGNGRNTECIFCPYISVEYGQHNGDCIKCSDLGVGYYPDNCDGIGCHDCVYCPDYANQGYGILEVYGADQCVPCSSYDTVLNTNTLRCE